MKVSIKIKQDTHNTYPHQDLEVAAGENYIHLRITGEDREIAVAKEELKQALAVLLP